MAVSFAAGVGAAVNAYWGQTGGYFLRDICDTGVKYATVSFINNSPENGNGYPGSNFGANCAAEVYTNNGQPTKLLSSCTFIQRDIPYCQDKGVKVLLAVGGAPVLGTNYAVSSEAKGVEFAQFLYNAFGPYKSSWTGPRPFDQGPDQHVSVDGFDLDLEVKDKNWSNKPYIAMVNWWRQQSTKLFITAAPECVITTKGGNTNQNDDLIANAQFDALFIQFYNNPVCDAITGNAQGEKFSYDTFVNNIQSGKSKDAKIFIGLPASTDSAGSGYITPKAMKDLVCQYSTHKNFGGVSLWDGTRGLINKDIITGKTYVQSAVEAVNYICQEPPKTTTTKSTSTSTSTKTTSTTSSTTVKTTTTSTTTTSTSSAKPTTTSTTSTTPTSTSTTSSKATTTTSSTTVKTTTTSSTTSTKPTSTTTSSTKTSTSTTSSAKPTTTTTTSSKPATTTTTSSKPVTTTTTTSSKPVTTTTTTSSKPATTTTTSSKPVTTTTSEKPATTTTTTSSKPVTTTTSSEKPVTTTTTSEKPDTTTTTKTSATESTTTTGGSVTSTSTVTTTTSKPVSLTTSTVYTTSVHTVTKCPPTVTNCPVGHVTTETIPLYTTVCPVTETAHPPKPTTTKAPVLTTSTVYTTKTYTITKCPPAVTNCPVGHVTTEVVPAYTTVCPVEETETGNVPQPTGPAPLTTNTETRTLTRTVKVQGSSSLQTMVRPTDVPQPSAEGCSGPGCPGVTSTPGSGCTGPECPGVAIPTNSWTSSPVGPSATPSTPVTAGASTLALGLTGLVAIVAAQLFAM